MEETDTVAAVLSSKQLYEFELLFEVAWLGIGDQGVGGILISIAKLALVTLCAGVHPQRCLGVVLDSGTNNEKLLNDDLYLGIKENRVRGKEYDDFVDKFVKSVQKLFPKAYLHFEDFGVHNARRLLNQYRGKHAVFNDDVQGTGCVTLASIMAAAKLSDMKIGDLRVLSYGAGSAGTGKCIMSHHRYRILTRTRHCRSNRRSSSKRQKYLKRRGKEANVPGRQARDTAR